MLVDYHVHTNYSDGDMLHRMVRAAEAADLDGVGFADHCNVSERAPMRRQKKRNGFNLDTTYGRRREALAEVSDRADIRVFDAVEMDYHPDDAAAIETFLDEADFDYVVGSVHFIDDVNVHVEPYFRQLTDAERRQAVNRYIEMLVQMLESGLVDIAAHMDVFERNAALRGLATPQHYERVADALERSETVPEINAGRLLSDYGETHPSPGFLDVLLERGIPFTFGTDSHAPEELKRRVPALQEVFAERDIEPVTVLD